MAGSFTDIGLNKKWRRFLVFWFFLILVLLPVGVAAQSVTVSWDANSEADLLGYKIYYGISPGSYNTVIDVGNVLEKQIENLTSGQTYYFAVTAYDTAFNESGYSQEASIILEGTSPPPGGSSTPPAVTDVVLMNRQTMKVYFSQEMSKISVANVANYSFTGGIQIVSIKTDSSLMFIEITTSTHDIEKDYSITISNVTNNSGVAIARAYSKSYRFPDTQPPFVTGISLVNLSTIMVSFNEKMETQSVTNKNNYSINPSLTIHSVEIDQASNRATITTDPHSGSVNYVLTVQGVKDVRNNTLSNSFSISYSYSDQSPPQVVSVEAENQTALHCYFSEKMDYASIADKNNYVIQPSVQILDVLVDNSLQKVTLRTAEHQQITPYELRISGVKDFSQVPLPQPFVYSYSFSSSAPAAPPATPPSVTDVIRSDLQTIRVYFSQQMDKVGVTDLANYSISPHIQIVSVTVDQSLMFVILSTSTHKIETDYTLKISNVKNISNIPLAQTYTKQYRFSDNVPPFIVGINLAGLTSLEITFNEKVDAQTALDKNNYSISPTIGIQQISLEQNSRKAILTTEPHSGSVNYTLSVQGIKDLKGNPIIQPFTISYSFSDQTPPEVAHIQVSDRTTIHCFFSKRMDYQSISDKTNYNIEPGIEIYDVVVDSTNQRATLRTAEHHASINYKLTISNVKDFSQIKIKEPYYYSYNFTDDLPPYVEKMELISLTTLKLYFNEELDANSVNGTENFKINSSVQVLDVSAGANYKVFTLTTQKHEYDVKNVLVIKDLYDVSNNMISDNYQIEYEFRRSAGVDSISKTNYVQASGLNVGDQYYVDRAYKITTIPAELQNLTWIRTSNNDKFSTGDQLFSFKVAESVVVYVGHDEKIPNLPGWLQDWTKTDLVMRDDQNSSFRFYSKTFSAEKIILGGNYGADQSNMYVVLIKSQNHYISYPDPPNAGRFGGMMAKNFELLQNYPNPFNPFTEIPFVAKERDHVTLTIYDLLGRIIKKFELDITSAGQHKIVWDSMSEEGLPVSSGVYIYNLRSSTYQETKKMILVR